MFFSEVSIGWSRGEHGQTPQTVVDDRLSQRRGVALLRGPSVLLEDRNRLIP